eukprot:3782362-Alexandrium_andersonii.AAC.1
MRTRQEQHGADWAAFRAEMAALPTQVRSLQLGGQGQTGSGGQPSAGPRPVAVKAGSLARVLPAPAPNVAVSTVSANVRGVPTRTVALALL